MPLDEPNAKELPGETHSLPEERGSRPLPPRVADLEHPWPGLDSFREEDRDYFFGRTAEVAEIHLRLRGNPLLVLYSRSGLGKTSILRAGLVPRLRDEGRGPTLERLKYDDASASPCDQICLALFGGDAGEPGPPPSSNTAFLSADRFASRMDRFRSWERDLTAKLGISTPDDAASRLWLRLHWRLKPPAATHLILDQFEEVFTRGARWPGAEREVRDALAILLQGAIPEPISKLIAQHDSFLDFFDPDSTPVRVVLALRDDYVFALNRWKRHIAGLGQNNFELLALRGPAALDAVFKPGELRCHFRGQVSDANRVQTALPPIISKETAERIVRFVANKPEDVPVEEIEAVPPILSLLCRELNDRRFAAPDGTPEKPAAQIAFREGENDIKTIIAAFYERCLAGRPPAVRIFIEENLVSSGGGRLAQYEKDILRVFEEGCEIPGAADGRRAEGHGNAGAARACLEDLVNRRLLTPIAGEDVTYELIHDLLAGVAEKSRLRREQEILTERAKLRAEAEQKAKEEAQARARQLNSLLALAEDQVGFLIGESLLDKLRPFGRNEVLEQVQRQVEGYLEKAEDYFKKASGTNSGHEAIRGLALRNGGALMQAKGLVQQAITNYQGATSIFQRLAKIEPNRPQWKVELARTLDILGSALRAQGRCLEALAVYTDALDLRQALYAAAPRASQAILDLAEGQGSLGSIMIELGRPSTALTNYEAMLKLLEPLREATDADQHKVLKLLNSGYEGLGDALQSSALPGNADAFEKGLAFAHEFVQGNPLDASARYRVAVLQSRLHNLRMQEEGGTEELLQGYRELNSTLEELVRWDASKVEFRRNRAATLLLLGEAHSSLGHFRDATNAFGKALNELIELSRIDPSNSSSTKDLSWPYSSLGNTLCSRRDWSGARNAYESQVKLLQDLTVNEQSPAQWRRELGVALVLLGKAQIEQKEFTNAFGSFQQGRTVISNLWSRAPEMAALLDDLLGSYDAAVEAWQAQGKMPEADALTREADQILQQHISGRTNNPNVWYFACTHQWRLAQSAERHGQASAANQAYRRGLKNIRKAVELDPHRWLFSWYLSDTYKRIGDLLSKTNAWSDAEEAYGAALAAAREGFSRSTNANLQNQIYRVHVAAGDMCRDRGKSDAALKEYTQAKSAIAEAMRMAPSNLVYLCNLWDLQERLGQVKRKSNDLAGAEQAYKAAVDAAQQAVELAPDSATYANQLHLAHYYLAGLQVQQGDYAAGLAQYALALSALQKALERDPSELVYFSNLRGLHQRIGEAKRKVKDLAGAEQAYKAAVAAATNAVKLAPDSATYANELHLALCDLAGLQVQQRDYAAALPEYALALAALEKAGKAGLGQRDYLESLGRVHRAAARANGDAGNSTEAEKAYYAAVDAAQRASELDTNNAVCANLLGVARADLAGALLNQPDKQAAFVEYSRAIGAVAAAIRLSSNVPLYHQNLARIYRQVADARTEAGDLAEAERAYRNAANAAGRALELVPDNSEYANDVFLAQLGLGRALQKEKRGNQATLTEFARAVEAVNAAIRLEDGSADYHDNLAIVHQAIGDLWKDAGNIAEAERAYLAAVSAATRATELMPASVSFLCHLYGSQARLGMLPVGKADTASRVSFISSALANAQQAARMDPKDSKIAEDIKALQARQGELFMR